jgi:hypothetical protein
MTTKGVWQRLVLGTVLAAGFAVVWSLVGLWAAEIVAYVVAERTNTEHLTFLADGTPRVASIVGPGQVRQYRDLEGNLVQAPEADDHTGWLNLRPLPAALPVGPTDDGFSWDRRVRSFEDGRLPAGYWYFMCDGRFGGTGSFVGYDSQSHACIGYLGTAGHRDGPLPAEELIPFSGNASGPKARVFCTQREFNPTEHPVNRSAGRAPRGSVSTWDVYVLGRDRKIYRADLQQRTVHVVFDEPRLRTAALVAGPADPVKGTPHQLAARTDDAVLVLDEHGGLLRHYPIPGDLRERGFAFGETTAGDAVMDWNSPMDSLATQVEHRIYRVSPDGRTEEASATLTWDGAMRSMQVFGGLVEPAPVVLAGFLGFGRARDLIEEGLEANYPAALERAVAEFWRALLLAQLVSVGLAALCYRRQVRYGVRRGDRVVWPLFILVLGLPGWIGYRFGRAWPVLESCPACEVAVPRDRGDCVRCATEFPRPRFKGTEVFA